jgi:lipoate-protein ligase A
MLFVERLQTDPFFNIAAEEYLFKHFEEDVFMLWQNQASIVIGKHQNAYAEINYPCVKTNQIPVIRRISGGGTVYHDEGNLNFSFISKAHSDERISFKRILEPVIRILHGLSVPCELSGKSDLKIQGKKISGNAEHILKDKILHHGTLIYSTNPETIRLMLRNGSDRYYGKAVKSNPSETTFISKYVQPSQTLRDFTDRLRDAFMKEFAPAGFYSLTEEDHFRITQLVDQKYKTWQWNFGYSPPYQLQTEFVCGGKKINAEFHIKNGIIQEIHIFGTNDNQELIRLLSRMNGLIHEEQTLRSYLQSIAGTLTKLGFNPEEMVAEMF